MPPLFEGISPTCPTDCMRIPFGPELVAEQGGKPGRGDVLSGRAVVGKMLLLWGTIFLKMHEVSN